MNPEFLREGEAVKDFMNPDRIVLGGIDERSLRVMEEIYRPFATVDQIQTNPNTAEMIKYTANSLLATMISFSNEIGNLCAVIPNVDVIEVMRGVHLDKRLSPILTDGTRIVPLITSYIEAGCGFGGSCLPKDVKALIAHGQKLGREMLVLEAVVKVNHDQPKVVLGLLESRFSDFENLNVTVLGVAFKPGTDDIRESPALGIIRELLGKNARVKVFDPEAHAATEKFFGPGVLEYADSLQDAVDGSEALILLTYWPEFECLPEMIGLQVVPPVLIDGRRAIDKKSVPKYEGVGLLNSIRAQ